MIILARFFILSTLITALFLQTGCGGGSDSVTAPELKPLPEPIRVNAGNNVSLDENQTINLVGGSSGGSGAIAYQWQSQPSLVITHEDTSITNATLLTPSVTQVTVFSVSLVATDTTGKQQTDTISITVNPVNIAPVAVIQANQISPYNFNQFPVTSSITLSGSNSFDADPQSNEAAIVSYRWQQIAGPSLLAGIDTSQPNISLVAPVLNATQQATFRLTVTDQEQMSSSTDFSISLLSQQQTIPSVVAQSVRSVFSGEMTVLSAQASSVAPDAAPFTAQWSHNSNAQITDPTAFTTATTSPLVTSNTVVQYQISMSDSYRNTASTQVEQLVYAPVTRVINDTGATLFANQTQLSESYQSDFAGQDASYGADRQTLSGLVIKVGEGEEGFDFTRLDGNGDAIEMPTASFDCVRDNVTGLVWQVKDSQNPNSLSYFEQTFTWFSDIENGNFAGITNENATSCNVQSQSCNTQAYIEQVNSQGQCGFYDWRLPQVNELQSIIHYGKTIPPMVDSTFFPNLGDSSTSPLWYWTAQSSADGVSNDTARNAWAYDLSTGNDGFLDKTLPMRAILVRAGR